MPERYRSVGPPLIVIAICAIALIAASQTSNNRDQPYWSSEDAYSANEETSPVREPAVVGLFPPKNRPEPAYKAYSAEQYDLVAQRWMAWLTGLIALFTFIGIGLLWGTLRDTRQILDEARKTTAAARDATEAARDTTNATREIGERQLRPYIMYDSATLERWTVVGTEEIGYTAKIDFKNCGQNPGIIIAKSGTVYAPLGNGRWGSKGSAANKCRMVVGPGQTETLEFPTVRADDQGRITWFQIGVLILFENQHGDVFEEYVWLMYNGAGFSQAYDHAGRDLYRPEDWPEQPKD